MRYLSILGALAMGAMIFISSQAIAWQDSMNMHGTDSTATGRVVDPACYIAMDLKGAAHKQ